MRPSLFAFIFIHRLGEPGGDSGMKFSIRLLAATVNLSNNLHLYINTSNACFE